MLSFEKGIRYLYFFTAAILAGASLIAQSDMPEAFYEFQEVLIYFITGILYLFLAIPLIGKPYMRVINWIFITILLFKLNIQNTFFYEGKISLIIMIVYVLIYIIYVLINSLIILDIKNFKGSKITIKLVRLFPFISIVVIVIAIINSYSLLYMGMEAGSFNTKIGSQLDSLYFSACTYFTVGYGDINPVNNISKLLVISEVLIGYLATVLYIPTIINFLNKSGVDTINLKKQNVLDVSKVNEKLKVE